MGKLILGTVQFGLNYGVANDQGKPTFEAVKEMLNFAFLNGIDELDTADAYGDSQDVLSLYDSQSSYKYKIMSKFIDDGSKTFLDYFNNSLKRLKRENLKGYYFHHFDDYKKFSRFKDVQELKEKRLLELFGVSLYSTEDLKIVINDKRIDLIQLPYNALDNNQEKREILEKAKELGKKIYIRSAFLQGVLVMPEEKIPLHLSPLKNEISHLKYIAKGLGLSMQELCIGYLNSKSFIDGILIGVDNIDQLKANMNLSKIVLESAAIDDIEKIIVKKQSLLNPANWRSK